jgi:hypothetical protein
MSQQLLTNIPLILELKKNGNSYQEIAQQLEDKLNIKTKAVIIKQTIYSIRKDTINKRYNDFVVIDGVKSSIDKTLDEYAVDFHGLLVTNKTAIRHMEHPEFIIDRKNIASIWDKESILYAKRLLKLYQIPDSELLNQHDLYHQKALPIDYSAVINQLHTEFDTEVNRLIADIKIKHSNYLFSQWSIK